MTEMETPTMTTQRPDLRDFLAAERTFLAWIRTGLALMGFGFVVARFGLFLREIELGQHALTGRTQGLSLWFGTALILLGVVVSALSSTRYLRLVRALQRGQLWPSRPSLQAVLIALFLALMGLGMAIYQVSLRSSTNIDSNNKEEVSMTQATGEGIINKRSNHSVDQTVDRLKNILQSKGVKLFVVVDHSGEAEMVGLKMPPTKLLIFGNPKAGTPLMLAAPSIAIDLPLKILVWEDAQKRVWVSYNSPEYLQQRHGLPEGLLGNIEVVGTFALKAAE